MKLKLGYSTCPNDTFIFEAMVHNRVDTEDLHFEEYLSDVEELNTMAFRQELDITKLSYHAYAWVSEKYIILDSGSALGENNGPLLLGSEKIDTASLRERKIAIPGKYTTANLLMKIAYPEVTEKEEYLFSDIEDAILTKKVELGLAIHENRFTYKARGLKKITDLGEYWENLTGSAIPLGGIMIRRDMEPDLIRKVNRVLKRSIEYAFAHPQKSLPYVRSYAREMDEEVMKKHIALYVNHFTIDLGAEGKKSVNALYRLAEGKNLIPKVQKPLFSSELTFST